MGGYRLERGNKSNKEQNDASTQQHAAADGQVKGLVIPNEQGL
jgi:hypothetical protein